MIATRIRGGLGNQLFQYACGRAVALEIGTNLALDIREYVKDQQFPCLLDQFKVSDIVTECDRLPPWRGMSLLEAIKCYFNQSLSTFREDFTNGFDPRIKNVCDDTLLKGYWQSEQYFSKHSATIRDDLVFKTSPSGKNAETIAKITDPKTTAISIHMRRGDYVSNKYFLRLMGTVELEYYKQALEYIIGKVERVESDPVAFVFSDEPAYARETLLPKLPCKSHLISHNDHLTAHEDLRLMSACQHNIIANSTFSWWGAWLNPSLKKLVVAPKNWFSSPDVSEQANHDIVPQAWLRM